MRIRFRESDGDAWLVAGLGNPGPEYERTRHNIGFRVLDALGETLDARFKRGKHAAQVAECKDGATRIVLVKPLTFMNESGNAVAPLARYYGVSPARIVTVYDEIDLPFGEVRMKIGGGAAGHNGVRSLVASLSTNEFVRIRCGVGRPPGAKQAADYVLSRFAKREEEALPAMIDAAVEATLLTVREGASAAQNLFNTRP